MAKLMLIGKRAHVELAWFQDSNSDNWVQATCTAHPLDPACTWTRRYAGMQAATEWAPSHADEGEW